MDVQLIFLENKKVLFCGGASSIDRVWRKPHISWWPQEKITKDNIEECLKHKEVDIIVTHECPQKAFERLGLIDNRNVDCMSDRRLLQVLMDEFKPKAWIFGHYHSRHEFEIDGTKFLCCPMIDSYNSCILKWQDDQFEWINELDLTS